MSHPYQPLDPTKSPRFAEIATFSRLPYVSDLQGKGIDVAILGIPFDGGTTFRPGARFAPRAVRDASVLCRNYNPAQQIDVYENLKVVDAGDVSANPLNIASTHAAIEKRIEEIHAAGARALTIGGDHSTILPDLRAVKKKFGEFTLVHFDAHTDTADQAWGEKLHHGTPIRRAIEDGAVNGAKTFMIGIRGPLTTARQDDYIVQQKIDVLDIDAFYDLKKREVFFEKLRKVAGTGPIYISFDVDGVDPAFTPGTGTPVVGGMTSFEAIQSVRRLKGLRLVGATVVEISPPYDHADITSLFGAAMIFEFLSLMAATK